MLVGFEGVLDGTRRLLLMLIITSLFCAVNATIGP